MSQKMNLIKVDRCRVCNSRKLRPLLSLGKQYLSDFLTQNEKPHKYPLDLLLCEECHLVQLQHNAPQEEMYTERYGYRSGINQTMKAELKEIVKKTLRRSRKKKNITVVDIGANDGTLLANYPKKIFRVGIEPIKKFTDEYGKSIDVIINDFFSYKSYKKKMGDKKANIITAISCFYDIEQPNEFIEDIKKILDEDGIFVIQQNYLTNMLRQNAYDNIVHEHLEYYTLFSLENLLKRHNLEVFDVELSDINGGSFRTYIANTGKRVIHTRVVKMRDLEKRRKLDDPTTYIKFADRVKSSKLRLQKLLTKLNDKGKKVYIYGASTRGNTILQYCEINTKIIPFAVERNPEKWGKVIASVGIPIISEEEARKKKPDYMLVLPWFFKKEFLKREKKYLESGGHFIFPLPRLEIVSTPHH